MEGWLFEGWIGGVGLRRGGYVKGLGGIRIKASGADYFSFSGSECRFRRFGFVFFFGWGAVYCEGRGWRWVILSRFFYFSVFGRCGSYIRDRGLVILFVREGSDFASGLYREEVGYSGLG